MSHRTLTRTRSAAALALTAGLLLAPVPSIAAAAPTPVVAPAAIDHSLHLTGAPNARDLGGYTTTDGKTVRSGLVLRSDALNAVTDEDLAKLQGLNVKTVEDLRTGFEISRAKDKLPAGATWVNRDVAGSNPANAIAMLNLAEFYKVMPTDAGASAAFKAALLDIKNSPDSVLYHCTSGKDRTGWLSAVLLTILGVPRETVNADYMLSNEYVDPDSGGLGSIGSISGPNPVEQAWLDNAFAAANQKYGSFDNYVSEGLGLTSQDITDLKAKLLS
ncbi:tyrosine-protein phosphatase [Rhodococcus sp. NPDC059234]|uniref:tyrosine-protein phosphatase n=1 Tax=Rhodococcus sp. NPDC059234 TaxID=3346781 RepID=UPI003671957E